MKKLFVIALAAFGMVACMNDEITELPSGNEISFDNAFIDNATRAELTAANLGEFKVWGYIDGLGDANNQQVALFEGETVSNATGAWQYGGGARYWAPEEMHYFEAVAPLTAAVSVVADATNSGKISTIEYTVDGESDLIYAAYSKQAASANQDNGPVSFTFDHLLSRVMFTFNNGFAANENVKIQVKGVKMTAPAGGVYDVANKKWSVDLTSAAKTLTFDNGQKVGAGAGDADERAPKFVVPCANTYTYAISFVVDVYFNDILINENVAKTSSVAGVALEQGKSYNFTATIDSETLNMESIEFEVGEVDGWESGNVDYNQTTFYVENVTEFQKALNYAVGIENNATRADVVKPVPTTIYFAKDIAGNVTITEDDTNAPYHNITIDGRGFKYDGQMSIQGNSNEGKGKLLIKNINFETETESRDFVWCAETAPGSIWRYGNNITIEDCTFTANGAAVHTAVGARFQQCYNIKLTNCVATNMHSLMQAESCGTTVVVEGSKVVNGKNGVSFNNTMNAIISNTEIEAVGEGSYGIRHKGQEANYALTVENCKVNAFAPVLVRNMTNKVGYTLTLKGNNEFTSSNAFDIDVVISASNYENDAALPAAPTGKYTIVGDVEDFKVFPEDVLMQDAAALQEAINAGGYVVLGDDVEIAETLTITNDVTLDLQGKTIAGGFAKVDGVSVLNIAEGATLTIKNGLVENDTVNGAATIINNGTLVLGEGAEIVGAPIGETGYPEYAIASTGKLTIEEGATVCSDRGALRLNAGADVTINGGNIYVTDALGTRTLTSHVICAYDGAKVTIKGGDFTSYYPNTSDCGASVICPWGGDFEIYGGNFTYVGATGQGGCFQNYMGAGSTVNVYGGTYSDNSVTKWIADDYHAVVKDGKYIILPESVEAVAGTTEELKDAIANGSGEKDIQLNGDVTYNTKITNDANIDLNGNTFEATGTIELGNNADLTMVGGDYEVNGTYGHVDVRPTTAEGSVLVFEDIDFSFNKLNYSYGPSTNRLGTVVEVCATAAGAYTKILFKKCTFANAQVLFEGLSGTVGTFEATFEECTFNALTSSAPIYVQNYVEGTINVKGCTFNLECTSSTASAISVSSSSSTTVTVNAENNTINATAATPSGVDGTVEQVKVNGTPKDIKFISASTTNTTINETNTTKTGIANF